MEKLGLDEIERLVDLVADSAIGGITLEFEGRRLLIRKGRSAPAPRPVEPPAAAAEEPTASAAAEVPASDETSPTYWVTAPMVGIFYSAEPSVTPGSQIESGQVVGVIESMKLMNDIRAEVSGVVRELLVEPGMAVEYGQPLFAVEQG